mgnify:FL=1|tara:strand:- start:512 stop:697 length:186 start_codon:yes stop_codon:yes gene_type:complete
MKQIELTLTFSIPYDEKDSINTLRAFKIEQELRKDLLDRGSLIDGVKSVLATSEMAQEYKL